MTYLTRCQIEHLVKMYLKMNIPIKMTFDLVKSDKGYLYYISTLGVSLIKMALGLVKKDKYYLYQLRALSLVLGKLKIYNINNYDVS
jgi:hypothetical protein